MFANVGGRGGTSTVISSLAPDHICPKRLSPNIHHAGVFRNWETSGFQGKGRMSQWVPSPEVGITLRVQVLNNHILTPNLPST